VRRWPAEQNNGGGFGGGGIQNGGPQNLPGSVLVASSTISGNVTGDEGGGIEAYPSLTMTITNSALAGNHGGAYGGAIDDSGNMTVTRSAISGNVGGGRRFAGFGPAAVVQGGASLQISNSTIAGNSSVPVGQAAIDN
jgi:hypothetical protein